MVPKCHVNHFPRYIGPTFLVLFLYGTTFFVLLSFWPHYLRTFLCMANVPTIFGSQFFVLYLKWLLFLRTFCLKSGQILLFSINGTDFFVLFFRSIPVKSHKKVPNLAYSIICIEFGTTFFVKNSFWSYFLRTFIPTTPLHSYKTTHFPGSKLFLVPFSS